MRITRLLIGLSCAAIFGCQSMPHPAPGLSALQVKVIAEPKAGTVSAHVSTYDQSSGLGYGDFERVDYSDLDDIVIWIEPASAGPGQPADSKTPVQPPSAPATFFLNGRQSQPKHLGVASVGQKIVFRNDGAVPLAIYCVSDGNDFNLGTIPPGGHAETVVKSAGLIELLADGMADPIARIYAAPSPWASLTHSGATVNFNDLPPGNYRIVSWHPRLPGSATDVSLLPDQVARGTVHVGVNQLPKITAK